MKKLFILITGLFLLFPVIANAQANRNPCAYNINGSCQNVGVNSPMPVIGNSNIPTYSVATVGLAYTVAGDIYCIVGSNTKVVKIKGIRVTATATSAIVGDAQIIMRSVLDTGGGLAVITPSSNDPGNSNIPAPTARVNTFTSAPSMGGTTVPFGPVRSRKMAASTQGNAATTSEGLFQFSVYWDQPITLRSANMEACVNVSAFGTGANFDIDHEHTEE